MHCVNELILVIDLKHFLFYFRPFTLITVKSKTYPTETTITITIHTMNGNDRSFGFFFIDPFEYLVFFTIGICLNTKKKRMQTMSTSVFMSFHIQVNFTFHIFQLEQDLFVFQLLLHACFFFY